MQNPGLLALHLLYFEAGKAHHAFGEGVSMAIITISMGTLSGGKALSQCLVRCLGYRFTDREAIIGSASVCGTSEEKLRDAIERPPGFWDHFTEEKRHYMTLFQACLAEQARQDGLIYLGNAGHLLLHGVSHVLRVRIIAPLEYRLRVVQQESGISRDKALVYVEKKDHERARWTRFLYGVDWSDPALYDVVLNLQRVTIEESCRIVATMANDESFRPTPDSQSAINDLALSCRVRAAFLMHPETATLVLDVVARDGVVTLRGKVRNHKQWQTAENIAQETPGVERLVTDELVQVLDR